MNLCKKLYLERKDKNLSKKELSEKMSKISDFYNYTKKKDSTFRIKSKRIYFSYY